MNKKWVVFFWIALLMIGCMPHPRIDWMNSKYYGHIFDSNGKPIKNALVVVKNNNPYKSVVQVTQTDNNGDYEIKAKKTFLIFGTLLAPEPECIDDVYIVHPDYEVYFKQQPNRRKYYGRLCTEVEVKKNFVLRKKLRRSEDYEIVSLSNIKTDILLYNYDEHEEAEIWGINKDNSLIIRYVNGVFKTQTIGEISSILFIKKELYPE